jgi:4-hydroxy 2-oxovalerate aldolase
MKRDVIITEVALRDGSHAMRHQFTEEQVRAAVAGLDAANVPYIEVAHGDGLGGSTVQYGHSLTDEFKLVEAAVETAKNAKIAVLSLPGIATKPDIKRAAGLGVSMLRVATHVTEADVSLQHLSLGKELGLETVGFLMMSLTWLNRVKSWNRQRLWLTAVLISFTLWIRPVLYCQYR